MVDVGGYVGNIVDSAMEPVGLGGGIAGLAQDVYNNTVNDPGAMMGIAKCLRVVSGRGYPWINRCCRPCVYSSWLHGSG